MASIDGGALPRSAAALGGGLALVLAACPARAPAPAPGGAGAGLAPGGAGPAPASTGAVVRVEGRWFKDARGEIVRLRSINWEGFNDSARMLHGLDRQALPVILGHLRALGFDSVRVPFANELLRSTEPTRDEFARLHPWLRGLPAREAFVRVVDELTRAGFLVVLDNHQTSLGFYPAGDGMWFTADHGEDDWIADWVAVADLFRDNPRVIGYELRNEVRAATVGDTLHTPTWGGGGPDDWKRAQIAAARAIWARDAAKIVFVSGLNYQLDLGDAYSDPFTPEELGVTGQPSLAYSAHVYGWLAPWGTRFGGARQLVEYPVADQDTIYGETFGFVITQDRPFTGPLWVSELGTSSLARADDLDARYRAHFEHLVEYLERGAISFAYYNISSYYPKQPYAQAYDCLGELASYDTDRAAYEASCSTYGLFTPSWDALADDWRVAAVRRLTAAP